MQTPYLFMPQNMLLLEICIIAIPSFFLSLQPNKDRVRGKFITHVMSGAVSGALLMVICVMSMYITNSIDSKEFGGHYQAMCMIALTFSGLVMVYRICRPFNVYRAVLCASMLALCITAFAIPQIAEQLYKGWSDIKWDYAKILIVVVVIEAAFPVSGWLIELMHFIFPSSTGKQRHAKQQPPVPPAPPAPPADSSEEKQSA